MDLRLEKKIEKPMICGLTEREKKKEKKGEKEGEGAAGRGGGTRREANENEVEKEIRRLEGSIFVRDEYDCDDDDATVKCNYESTKNDDKDEKKKKVSTEASL